MEFLDLPYDILYLIRKRLSKYDQVFFDLTCRCSCQLKNYTKRNKDLAFCSSMTRFRYGGTHNIITINPVTCHAAIYHDNLELFLMVRDTHPQSSEFCNYIEESAKYKADKIYSFVADNHDYNNFSYLHHNIGSAIRHLHYERLNMLLKDPRFLRIREEAKPHLMSQIDTFLERAVESGSVLMFEEMEDFVFQGDKDKIQQYKEGMGKWLCRNSINNNDYHMFQYLKGKEYPYDVNIAEEAAMNGALDSLRYLHLDGFPISATALYLASSHNNHKIVEYIIRNVKEIEDNGESRSTMGNLMYHGKLELAKILASKGVRVCSNYAVQAKSRGYPEITKWVMEEYPEVFNEGIDNLFDFLVENEN